jgi:hypothetical protein
LTIWIFKSVMCEYLVVDVLKLCFTKNFKNFNLKAAL